MAIPQFLDYLQLEKKYSSHTLTAYKADLKSFSEFIVATYGRQDLLEVNYSQIRSWMVVLVNSGISNRSINRKISSLKSYYKFLQKTKQLEHSPLAKHSVLKMGKKLQVPFSKREMELALEEVQPETYTEFRDQMILILFYATGIRRSELIGLRLEDVDLENQLLKVLGKRNKERFVPLLAWVVEELRLYFPEREKIENSNSAGYLFLTGKGVKVYETLVYRVINNYFRTVSSKQKKSPHILRHSFATHLLNQGASLHAIKELLGHSSLAATQVYTHNSLSELNSVYQDAHPRNKKEKS